MEAKFIELLISARTMLSILSFIIFFLKWYIQYCLSFTNEKTGKTHTHTNEKTGVHIT